VKAGDVFALDCSRLYADLQPALRGKFGVVWCLGPAPEDRVRCAVADELFDEIPSLTSLERRTLRVRNLPQFDQPCVYLLQDGKLPRGVTYLGTLAQQPSVSKREAEFVNYAAWSNFVIAWDAAWRRENQVVTTKEVEARARDAAVIERRRAGGLEGYARRRLAKGLTELVSKRRAEGLRRILRVAVDELRPAKSRAARTRALEAAVLAINEYDDAQRGFIDTPVREVLLECLRDLAALADLGDLTAKLDRWRDW